jgi:two-component system chemotaxis response regulator CheB
LIVDDSVVFRSQIRAALEGQPSIDSVAIANNGKIALQKLAHGAIDLITLDMEMPEMSGLETIREIRKAKFPVRIIVFSSHTRAGSEMALEALAAGADDFTAKPSGEDVNISNAAEKIRVQLLPKILQFKSLKSEESMGKTPTIGRVGETSEPSRPSFEKRNLSTFLPNVLLIGSSTGGPPALERLLMGLRPPFRIPVLIVQHMPAVFTASLAKRLGASLGIEAGEAVHDQPIVANRIYVAPGEFHFTVRRTAEGVNAQLDKSPQRNSVRPCVDSLFETAVEAYGSRCMAVILTGMGEDGLLGCRAVKKAGGGVMIQDKESCVVFGMPGAIFKDGCYDGIGEPEKIGRMVSPMLV